MELLKAFVWIWIGWAVSTCDRRRRTALLVTRLSSPHYSPQSQEPLRPRLLEPGTGGCDEAAKQRVATLCLREGKSLIYIAVCPWHTPTADTNSTGKCFNWDVETGMAHCFWCGWGGRVARPLVGPVHPDLLPTTFRLVLVT